MKDTFPEKLPATLEGCIPLLIALRDRSDVAEEMFIRACMVVEESTLWTECESPRQTTFGAWLNSVSVCGPERYDRGAAALRNPEIEGQLAEIGGMHAARQAIECPDDRRSKLLKAYRDYSEEHYSTRSMPRRTAQGIRLALIGGKERQSMAERDNALIEKLKTENAKLREDVKALKMENAKLRDKLTEKKGSRLPPTRGTPTL